MKALIVRHAALAYFILTFAISWGGVLMVVGPGGFPATKQQFDALFPFAVMAMLPGPPVAGILLTGLVDGRAGLRGLWSRLLVWRVSARWYAIALLTAPLVFGAVLLALSASSPAFLPGLFTATDQTSLLMRGIVVALAAGFFEELGWTGFATPRLRLRFGVMATGLVIGPLWGAWHFLVNVWAAGISTGPLSLSIFLPAIFVDLLLGNLLAFRVLMVWVYDRTGSLLLAMLMHASLTACTIILAPVGLSGAPAFTYDFALTAAFWAVIGVVYLVGEKLRDN